MLNPQYIVGLVDGEGSFTVQVKNPNSSPRRRAKVEPRFYLKLQEKDKPLLDALHKFFRCGNVYIQRDKRKNHKLCYRYEVANRQDVWDKIIPFFQKYQLKSPSKRKDFDLFCQIMDLIKNNRHFDEEGMKAIRQLKIEMH